MKIDISKLVTFVFDWTHTAFSAAGSLGIPEYLTYIKKPCPKVAFIQTSSARPPIYPAFAFLTNLS